MAKPAITIEVRNLYGTTFGMTPAEVHEALSVIRGDDPNAVDKRNFLPLECEPMLREFLILRP